MMPPPFYLLLVILNYFLFTCLEEKELNQDNIHKVEKGEQRRAGYPVPRQRPSPPERPLPIPLAP